MLSRERRRTLLAFALLFACYQAAEGVGARLFGSFAMQGSLMIITVALAWPLGHWMGFRGWQAYALEWRPFNLAWLGGGLVMALLAKYVAACLGLALGVYRPARIAFEETTSLELAMALGTAVVFTFIPSFAEDILTRGFWYRAARIGWRGAWFVPFSALMFMLNHIYRLGDGPSQCLMLASFGLAYAMALWRSGSLWLAVGLHWGWNLANALLDRVLPVEVVNAAAAPYLSAAVHLALAAMLLAVPKLPSEMHQPRQ